jgi:hypothetical protein
MNITKSTITITDDGKQVKFEVVHDPHPTGPRNTWHIPAKTADGMCRKLINAGMEKGIMPIFEATRNAITGHVDVTTRTKEEHAPDRTDQEADGDGGRQGD